MLFSEYLLIQRAVRPYGNNSLEQKNSVLLMFLCVSAPFIKWKAVASFAKEKHFMV